jgi:hypothetical protein
MPLTALPTVATGDTITAARTNQERDNFNTLDARTGGDPGATNLVPVSDGTLSSGWRLVPYASMETTERIALNTQIEWLGTVPGIPAGWSKNAGVADKVMIGAGGSYAPSPTNTGGAASANAEHYHGAGVLSASVTVGGSVSVTSVSVSVSTSVSVTSGNVPSSTSTHNDTGINEQHLGSDSQSFGDHGHNNLTGSGTGAGSGSGTGSGTFSGSGSGGVSGTTNYGTWQASPTISVLQPFYGVYLIFKSSTT